MTVWEIAEQARFSIGTFDRVMHGRGRVSPETKARILAIIKESGYTPNPMVRHLKLNKLHTFAVVMPALDEDSGYWRIVCKGINKAQKELAAFGVAIHRFEFNRYNLQSFLRTLAEFDPSRYSGLFMAPVISEESRFFLQKLPEGFPLVFFDAHLPAFSPRTPSRSRQFPESKLKRRVE